MIAFQLSGAMVQFNFNSLNYYTFSYEIGMTYEFLWVLRFRDHINLWLEDLLLYFPDARVDAYDKRFTYN